jgi:hypothetical protein
LGYFAAGITWAAVAAGCDFSLGAARNKAAWRAAAAIPADGWAPATGMKGAEVAVASYAPAGWPPGVACVVRRVRIPAEGVSIDPRARKRRNIPKDQLALALDGLVDEVFGYSFIATNIDVSTQPRPCGWRRGTANVPISKTESAMPNTAPRYAICPPATETSTRSGGGAPCWQSTCRPGYKNSPASMTATDAGEPTWAPCATSCWAYVPCHAIFIGVLVVVCGEES